MDSKQFIYVHPMLSMLISSSPPRPGFSVHQRVLSSGKKMRVNIVVELLTCPQLLFLYEPASGLDKYIFTSPFVPSLRTCA